MSRPAYETEDDRAAQDRALRRVVNGAWAMNYALAPAKSAVDAIAGKNGRWTRILEVKCRTASHRAYPTYMLARSKYENLLRLGEDQKVKPFLIVEWSDELGYVQLPCNHTIGPGGRTDRGDPADEEMCVYIPITEFTILEAAND